MVNVVLVGFPASGKSVLGRMLAHRMKLHFIDLDEAIEEHCNNTIPRIFVQYGECFFREREREALLASLEKDGVLIATGGGTPCYGDAMARINARAVSVYLKADENTLTKRLLHDKDNRPLVCGKSRAEITRYVHETLQRRHPYYAQATLTVLADDSADSIVQQIQAKLDTTR